jgi:hypothetical protein
MNLAMNVKFDSPDERMLSLYGMVPHGLETEELYAKHKRTLIDMIKHFIATHLDRSTITDSAMAQLVINILLLFYSNQKYPEHMNIMDISPDKDHNHVYSGKKFVEDIMCKSTRNRYILQRLMVILNRLYKENEPGICYAFRDFIDSHLIPHIVKCYFKDLYQEPMQTVWAKNCDLIQTLRIKPNELPHYVSPTLGDYDYNTILRDQIEAFKIGAEEFNTKSLRYELDTCYQNLARKQDLELIDTNPVIQLANAQEEQAQ